MSIIPTLALEAVGREELTKAATLFATLKSLRLRLTTDIDETALDRAFQLHTTSVLEKLDSRLSLLGGQNGDHAQLRAVEIIMAKHGIFDAAFQQVVVLNTSVSPLLGDSLKELRSTHLGLLGGFQACIAEYMSLAVAGKKEAAQLKTANAALKDECAQLLESVRLLDDEADRRQAELTDARRQTKLAEQRSLELERDLAAYRKLASKPPEKPRLDTYVEPQFKFLRTKTQPFSPSSSGATLPAQVASPSPRAASASRVRSAANLSVGNASSSSNNNNSSNNNSNKGGITNTNSNVNKTTWSHTPRGPVPAAAASSSSAPPNQPSSAHGASRAKDRDIEWLYRFRTELQEILDSGRCRTLSPLECRDAVERIYNDKTLSEKRSRVFETMEHFLYRSMEKKFGLRSLAVEHAAALLRSVEEHSARDSDLSCFLKIFRNEVDEEYRHVQTELRRSVKELLVSQIAADHPSKDEVSLQSLLEAKMKGSISETEWNNIIKYLYDGSDSAALNAILKRRARDEALSGAALLKGATPSSSFAANAADSVFAFGKSGAGNGVAKSTRTNPKVPPPPLQMTTQAFVKTMLDFQLKAHENYLAVFKSFFDRQDADHDGILTAAEFGECFRLLRQAERKKNNASGHATIVHNAKRFIKPGSSREPSRAASPAKIKILGSATTDAEAAEKESSDLATDSAVFEKVLSQIDPLKSNYVTFSSAAGGISRLAALSSS